MEVLSGDLQIRRIWMHTQVKIDLTQLFNEERPEDFSLVPIVPLLGKQIQKISTASKAEDLIICPNCKQSHYIKKGKKKNGTQRFKCKECGKIFSLLLKAIDAQLMFKTYYEEQNQGNPSMLNTVSRKIRACIEDERYRMCFNQLLSEYELKGEPAERCIALAFNESNKMIDRLEWRWLQKQKDNWYFFLNFNHSDITYLTLYLNQKLVRNHNIELHFQQDLAKPLLYCAECSSSNIVRHGFNHVPHRQIRCINCDTVSVIRVKNVISEDLFRIMIRNYLTGTKYHIGSIQDTLNDMQHEFYHTSLYEYFQTVVNRMMIITHKSKNYILTLFLDIYKQRMKLKEQYSHISTTGPFAREVLDKFIQLESNPRTFESNYPGLFDWGQQAISAYHQMIRDTKNISVIE